MPRRVAALALAVALALIGCAGNAAQRADRVSEGTGSQLPAIELPLLQGGTWRSADALGSVLVVDFWASWCKPCRKGFPRLDELARAYDAARFVAISLDEDEQAMRAFLREVPTQLPIALDAAQWSAGAPLSIARVPTVLVVDQRGIVRLRVAEPTAEDYALIDRTIARLLAE